MTQSRHDVVGVFTCISAILTAKLKHNHRRKYKNNKKVDKKPSIVDFLAPKLDKAKKLYAILKAARSPSENCAPPLVVCVANG